MAAQQAVSIINRREIAAAPDPEGLKAALAESYAAEHQNAHAAAQEGFIDEVILPTETRDRLCLALKTLATKRHRPHHQWFHRRER